MNLTPNQERILAALIALEQAAAKAPPPSMHRHDRNSMLAAERWSATREYGPLVADLNPASEVERKAVARDIRRLALGGLVELFCTGSTGARITRARATGSGHYHARRARAAADAAHQSPRGRDIGPLPKIDDADPVVQLPHGDGPMPPNAPRAG